MKTTTLIMALGIAAGVFTAPAMAAGSLVQFDGGFGVVPISSAQGTAATATVVNRNIVRGVQPPGQPWVIKDLRADVKEDGHIRVDGRGLLLSGGNGTGTTGNQKVFATLICEAAAPFIERSTDPAGVALDPNGDFRIDDALEPAPVDCASPVLLIRSTANKGWFAAGIPRR